MKILAAILSIYVLGLTLVPCVDGETSHVKKQATTSENIFFGDSHDHVGEACTPFCSCQCCQMQLTLVDFPVFESLAPNFSTIFIIPMNNLGKEFPTSLFHPPIV